MTRVFVPRDAAALALGADAVAAALTSAPLPPAAGEARHGAPDLSSRGAQRPGNPPQDDGVTIVRTGSRGLFWLEPMIEVETPDGRIAYGPVAASDVPDLLASGMLDGAAHRLRLGKPEDLPFLARQTRLTFARCGIDRPAVAGRLSRAWRPEGPAPRAGDSARHASSRK